MIFPSHDPDQSIHNQVLKAPNRAPAELNGVTFLRSMEKFCCSAAGRSVYSPADTTSIAENGR